MAAPDAPAGTLHALLVKWGPELLAVLGFVLVGLGVGLDRDWLAGFGLASVMLGVVLPRMRGALEAGPGGLKAGEMIDPAELFKRLEARGRNLPPEAIARAEVEARAIFAERAMSPAAVLWGARGSGKSHLLNYLVEGILSGMARREWRVTFVGRLSDDARQALDVADDMVLVSGHQVAGTESHSVIVNAPTANEAVNRVRSVVEQYGAFGRWEAKPFGPPGLLPDDSAEAG
jgi:hypothetical protein